jgi:hypothetical protein
MLVKYGEHANQVDSMTILLPVGTLYDASNHFHHQLHTHPFHIDPHKFATPSLAHIGLLLPVQT